MPSRFPLQWPVGWKRTKPHQRKAAKFGKSEMKPFLSGTGSYRVKKDLSVYDAVNRIASVIEMMGVNRNDVVISTNIETRLDGTPRSDRRAPEDPGAAVYWMRPGETMRCMAIDQYNTVADNLAAIAATLESMRAIERHGGAEILNRSFAGFAALPSRTSQPWREVLGIESHQTVSVGVVEEAARKLFFQHHPDRGGDRDKFEAVVEAKRQALEELAA